MPLRLVVLIQKRLLTKYTKQLEKVVMRLKEGQLEMVSLTGSVTDITPAFIQESLQRLEEGAAAIEKATQKVESALNDFAIKLQEIHPDLPNVETAFEEAVADSEQAIANAFEYVTILHARIKGFKAYIERSQDDTTTNKWNDASSMQTAIIKNLELPTIPIPTFNGDIWEWDNFWELFNTNIHSQKVSDLQKFNYLISSLKGEPLQAIKKFQISKENYQKAIDFLIKKYGNPEELILQLLDKLDKTAPRSYALHEQRTLLDHIQAIILQLIEKGENVNNQCMYKKVLSKFPIETQRKVLSKKTTTEELFDMQLLLQFLEEIISNEELISRYTTNGRSIPTTKTNFDSKAKQWKPQYSMLSCMYCKGNHKSLYCDKYRTPQERSQYLQKNGLCYICASSSHNTFQCSKPSCYRCQKRHHTSCCFYSQKEKPLTLSPKREEIKKDVKDNKEKLKDRKSTTKINQVGQGAATEEETSTLLNKTLQSTFLPTGEMTVIDPTTKRLKKISVLLDTGAELSFIDEKLAQELRLPTIAETKLRLHTFGSDEIKENISRKVPLDVWDADGHQLSLFLFTHDGITKPFKPAPICPEDVNFIRKHNLQIEVNKNKSKIKPSILLGCDQLWTLIKTDKPHIKLPSGLHLLPTRLGHLFTGKIRNSPQSQQNESENSVQLQQDEDETDKWDEYWTLQGQINTAFVQRPEANDDEAFKREKDDDEALKWEKYWTLESAGTEEFLNSEAEEKRLMDDKVWENFNNTIEKRSDGYYVRLPWKELHISLPDNKAIALNRLVSVWKSLQNNEDLLNMYNSIFEEQLRLNVLEEIVEEKSPQASRIHYIPHQAVLTPNKNTTKLRIVYDASAHYKGCPSLNDVLHRGPVILPELFGVLLRFRIGRIAITSDVEKAFLQVRLHEDDRDVTRCLWLYDHKSPPSPSNIKTLRFTRVTFGLITSPFLLAGTIHFHLNQYKQDSELVTELKDNLYVDNLILTVDDLEESLHIYARTKQIFSDLNMNLREFVSNNADLMAKIATQDKSDEKLPKVLGIPWNTYSDCLQLSCIPKTQPRVTKRTVASTLASVYDPMGFLLPLLHRAKVFLRTLWKDKYDWDNALPESYKEQWNNICTEMQGFSISLPRYLGTKNSNYTLVTFADASTEAIATCIYLRSEDSTNLLMAKGKLPSLKSTSTIPKMELDAVTLALRLTRVVLIQLQKALRVREIFIFSDSEIVLNWIKRRPLKNVGLRIFNRLMEIEKIAEYIQSVGSCIFFAHVASQYNAADCATRGLNQHELLDHFWWTGPSFLQESPEQWKVNFDVFQNSEVSSTESPQSNYNQSLNTVEEFSREEQQLFLTRHSPSNNKNENDIFNSLKKYSLPNAKRIVALIIRYIRILITKVNVRTHRHIKLSKLLESTDPNQYFNISGKEITIAGKMLVKQHQRSTITNSALQSMTHLNVRPDEEGLLRCFGRLGRSDLNAETKNPLLVLQNSWLAHAIIQDCHNKGHPGISHTMSIVRQKFWIPKLRAQVTRILRHCIQCQRFNNLPYKYPEQSDLPQQRVLRSRPFEHVGLDYFGPLTIIQQDSTEGKCYGAIITCMATRLIHLDIVSDLTTTAFLMFLRRFFARRGMPKSITSDNAPTFILAENILNECLQSIQKDPAVMRAISNREIQWRYITPFAPWQGGFYERLIKSVKHSLYKTLGTAKISMEHLTTVIIEIESLLNTRPLLYMESQSAREEVLRPIDFLQNEFEFAYPLDGLTQENSDPSYLPSDVQNLLRTKQQVVEALNSSCKFTEKFWKIWKSHYLTSLREKHQSGSGKKRSSKYTPKKDDIVLINDPIQPRHMWKIGRIKELVTNSQGISREAVILLPSHRQIRRPLNLLVPLELENTHPQEGTGDLPDQQKGETTNETSTATNVDPGAQKGYYNLRPKKSINYRDLISLPQISHISLILCTLLLLISKSQCSANPLSLRHITCINGGVELIAPDQAPYQICAEDFCKSYNAPLAKETVKLPPQVVLHEHKMQWRIAYNDSVEIIETTCQSAPFCDHVNCIFCSATVFNPECWPLGAILATTILTYLIITSCYVFLFVPVTLGKPIRIMATFIWRLIRSLFNNTAKTTTRRPTQHRQRPGDITRLLLAIFLAIVTSTEACQQFNLFSHATKFCTRSNDTETCKVKISDILRINPFKREACFKLLRNETTLHEIRIVWNSLTLSCEPETEFFTRDTTYRIVDSKRCPHTGSCKGTKCAQVNSSSLLPELEPGNIYPGITACVESCGGPGCDCFYWSSGCLFYRIYLIPTSARVYEIFHCFRWTETANVEITHFNAIEGNTQPHMLHMRPNVPVTWNSFTYTLSSITVPPIPALSAPFISDGNQTAIWYARVSPPLQCNNRTTARNLKCKVEEECTCYPAENQANCNCREANISSSFNDMRYKLPLILPSLTFHQTRQGRIQATIPSMITAEIILNIQDDVRTDVIVDSTTCQIDNAHIQGCYKCAKGAVAHITCTSSKPAQAEIVCTTATFTVPCDQDGKNSKLRFSFSNARIQERCTVTCGTTVTSFEIGGILKFTNTANTMFNKWLYGTANTEEEVQWPDFWHIADVLLQWYKTLTIALFCLLFLIGLTYGCISMFGTRIVSCIFRLIAKLIIFPFWLLFHILNCCRRIFAHDKGTKYL